MQETTFVVNSDYWAQGSMFSRYSSDAQVSQLPSFSPRTRGCRSWESSPYRMAAQGPLLSPR